MKVRKYNEWCRHRHACCWLFHEEGSMDGVLFHVHVRNVEDRDLRFGLDKTYHHYLYRTIHDAKDEVEKDGFRFVVFEMSPEGYDALQASEIPCYHGGRYVHRIKWRSVSKRYRAIVRRCLEAMKNTDSGPGEIHHLVVEGSEFYPYEDGFFPLDDYGRIVWD